MNDPGNKLISQLGVYKELSVDNWTFFLSSSTVAVRRLEIQEQVQRREIRQAREMTG